MTDRELMQQALDALECCDDRIYELEDKAIEALRARLAQPEPTKSSTEPVAWWVTLPNGEIDLSDEPVQYKEQRPLEELVEGCGYAPLYTAPPQRKWQGLTDEERNACLVEADPCEALLNHEAHELMQTIETKLKEKNT